MRFYLAGPGPAVALLVEGLAARGVDPAWIASEASAFP